MTQLVGKKLVLVLLLCCDCGLVRALHALRRRQRAAATVREKLPRPRRQGANLGQSTSWLLHHLGHRFADALNQSIEFRHKQTCLAAFPLHSWLSAACRRRARLEQVALSRSQVSSCLGNIFHVLDLVLRSGVWKGKARQVGLGVPRAQVLDSTRFRQRELLGSGGFADVYRPSSLQNAKIQEVARGPWRGMRSWMQRVPRNPSQ